MIVKLLKYVLEIAVVCASALPVFAPSRFHYLEKRISKFCLVAAAAVLCLSIADDVNSARASQALEARVKAAEKAAKPVPLPVRLRGLLEEIDPVIWPALERGQTGFKGGITASQFTRLQTIANEVGAAEFISIDPSSVRMAIGVGREGVTYYVAFTLDPKLLR